MKNGRFVVHLLFAAGLLFYPFMVQGNTVTGTMKLWKPVTIDFNGPYHSESDTSPNPFLDYRLQVKFVHSDSGTTYSVPGFFAGNGNGDGTGQIWRVYFTPDHTGEWLYSASFRSGANISVSLNPSEGSPAEIDGDGDNFFITNADENESLFYRQGRLESIGDFYFKFRDGGYWIKSGLNSPENFLGYSGFDNTPHALHAYSDFVQDWRPGDPDWDSPYTSSSANDGRAIIGLLNYLSDHGVNSIYFMPMNIGADGMDTWPYSSETIDKNGSPDNDNLHFDISKLEQWATTLSHAQAREIFLHFVLSDKTRENKTELDNATLGVERKLYYRELIARFGHYNALQWNISEEYDLDMPLKPSLIKEFAQYIADVDPYNHPITVHNHGNSYMKSLTPFIGDKRFGVMSIQTWQKPDDMGLAIEYFRSASQASNWKVPSSIDESIGINEISFADYRKRAIWDALFSGGMQELFVRYKDSKLEDFRQFENLFYFNTLAREFVENQLPFWKMQPADNLVTEEDQLHGGAEVFAQQGHVYAIYFPSASATGTLNLNGINGEFTKRWLNPRNGSFQGATETVLAGSTLPIGLPPSDKQEDWVVVYSLVNTLPVVVKTPQITPPGGTYEDFVYVWMSTPTNGASIYYTTDGTEPDQNALLYEEPFFLVENTTIKAKAYLHGYTESAVSTAEFKIASDLAIIIYQQDPESGLISIEAENYSDYIIQGPDDWVEVRNTDYSNALALQALPNDGTAFLTGSYSNKSPQLNYEIEFTHTGRHYIWFLGVGDSDHYGVSDSVNVGLDNRENKTSDRITNFISSPGWTRTTMDGPPATININSAGRHTINVWMREDGVIIDKLVISADRTFRPNGFGPDQSPQVKSY